MAMAKKNSLGKKTVAMIPSAPIVESTESIETGSTSAEKEENPSFTEMGYQPEIS